VSADIGARRLTNQFEAMRSLGARPGRYLYGNIVIALCVACPVLTVVAYVSNAYASLIAFLMTSPDATVAAFQRNYFAVIWPSGYALPKGSGWLLIKEVSTGLAIAALSYAIGAWPKASSVSVSRDVGLTIFWATLAVLGLHAGFSFLEF